MVVQKLAGKEETGGQDDQADTVELQEQLHLTTRGENTLPGMFPVPEPLDEKVWPRTENNHARDSNHHQREYGYGIVHGELQLAVFLEADRINSVDRRPGQTV
jgi:hypothetical protein